ncbi:MAG: hypothetical protein JSW61_08135 [Candidatus Thorarchaeota archaeon]|nr:MAG: hypothetical protein JSW61_08135 [Candidatus Thorarchaeota archaeon]
MNRRQVVRISCLGLAVAFLLSISLIGPLNASAAIVWSDDFSDGNFDDWEVTNGAFAIIDGRLESTSSSTVQSDAYYPHNVTMGTWSFDVFDPDVEFPDATWIVFIAESDSGPVPSGTWYMIAFWGFQYWFAQQYAGGITDLAFYNTGEMLNLTQSHSMDITLNEDDHFDVFFGGVHRMCVNTYFSLYYDSDITYLHFGSTGGGAIDNIVVQDVVDESLPFNDTCPNLATTTTTTPPETTTTTTTTSDTTTTTDPPPALPMELIALGVGIPVVLVIVVVVLRSRKG